MKITKRQLRRIIREMKSGQYEVNGQPFDDLAAAKKEAEASGFEVIDTSTEEVLYEPKKLPEGTKTTKRQLRRIIAEEKTKLLSENETAFHYNHIGDALHDEIIDIVGAAILESGYEVGEMSVEEARALHAVVKSSAEEAFENAMRAAGMDGILRQLGVN